MADAFVTMIVPAAQVELARAIAASFGPGGTGMWTTALSADGAEPASHYISSGYVPAEFAYLVPCQTWEYVDDAWVETASDPGDPVAVYNLAVEAGIICTQDDIDDLFANSDVTVQEPFVAIRRLGVQIVNPTMDSAP